MAYRAGSINSPFVRPPYACGYGSSPHRFSCPAVIKTGTCDKNSCCGASDCFLSSYFILISLFWTVCGNFGVLHWSFVLVWGHLRNKKFFEGFSLEEVLFSVAGLQALILAAWRGQLGAGCLSDSVCRLVMEWVFIGADGALSVPAGELVVIIISQGRPEVYLCDL